MKIPVRARWSLLPVLSFALLGLAACGSEDSVSLEVELVRPPHPSNCFSGFPCTALNALESGGIVRIRAFEGGTRLTEVNRSYAAGSAPSIPSFGFGNRLQMTVEAYVIEDGVERVLATGATPRFRLSATSSAGAQRILTTRPDRFTLAFGFDLDALPGEEIVQSDFFGSARAGHTLTRIEDANGAVAIGGAGVVPPGDGAGRTILDGVSGAIEYYEEETGLYYPLAIRGCQGSFEECQLRLSTPRAFHTATRLDDGRIVIAGGLTPDGDGFRGLSSVEVLRVFPERFEGEIETLATGLSLPRFFHTATRMSDGRVVFVGGFSQNYTTSLQSLGSTELTRPIDELLPGTTLEVQPSGVELEQGRALHAASFLDFEGVGLVVSGGISSNAAVRDTAEVFFLRDGMLERDAAVGLLPMGTGRYGHASLTLGAFEPNSPVQDMLVIGGFREGPSGVDGRIDILLGESPARNIETLRLDTVSRQLVFDPAAEQRLPADVAAGFPTVTLLPLTRDVLVAGGLGAGGDPIDGAVRLRRTREANYAIEVSPTLRVTRAFAPSVVLSNHLVLVSGGASDGFAAVASSEYFNPNDFQFIGTYD